MLKKTHSKFSYIPIDQGHEQNNDLVKSSGGAVGLTENPRRWMVAGPEQARLLMEFESQFMEEEKVLRNNRNKAFLLKNFSRSRQTVYIKL